MGEKTLVRSGDSNHDVTVVCADVNTDTRADRTGCMDNKSEAKETQKQQRQSCYQ
jgi:hypothetical protein